MIRDIRLENFKSIKKCSTIKLFPFSILCGANSCGKSSLIQSILMLSQTFSARLFTDSVSLNAHLIQLGSFSDILSHDADKEEVSMVIRIDKLEDEFIDFFDEIKIEFSFGLDLKNNDINNLYHPLLTKSIVTLSKIIDGENIESSIIINRNQNSEKDFKTGNLNEFKVIELPTFVRTELTKNFPGYKIIGCEKRGVIPTSIYIEYDHTKKISTRVLDFLVNQDFYKMLARKNYITKETNPTIPNVVLRKIKKLIEDELDYEKLNFIFPVKIKKYLTQNTFEEKELINLLMQQQHENVLILMPESIVSQKNLSFPEWHKHLASLSNNHRKIIIDSINKNSASLREIWYDNSKPERKTEIYELKHFIQAARYLEKYFTYKLKYLGPLRNEPQAIYPSIGLNDPTDVGLKGQFSAAILHINKLKNIIYPSPERFESYSPFDEGNINFKRGPLIEACLEWLSYLGVVDELDTADKGKFGYELNVKTSQSDHWQDLTHVGVGVSQVLPIVLICLLSEPGDVLIFEQPELHLHPKVQTRLSDFFIAMSLFKRQCIIETHSEYMINRLRFRIAQADNDLINKAISVIFIHKESGNSMFKNIEISKYGAIPDWPDEFFDQTQQEVEKILVEGSRKRRTERMSRQ
ncbi:DUF3696 domain-containing protein [Sodalis ligni]|uniref:Putative ATPase n=1 Tax=Sodalis ligni TaxID=2697027 RepID=A0A4R1N925_9GAMM|nr:DUF3696 domain-containing protein [Sodalis ligni]TCL03712.1 putative ATPase [Sodalis ligni]